MKKIFNKLAEFVFLFFLSAYLIKTAACWLYSVWPVLLAIGLAAIAAIVIFRLWRHWHNGGEW